jgi:phosphoglycerate dehydrogenase-like enzyme
VGTLLAASSVRWIHAGSAGVDHLIPYNPDRVMVTSSAGIQARPMAEYATRAVLHHVLRTPSYATQQRQHLWRAHPTQLAGGFAALVVGFGRIGQRVGEAVRGLGMRLISARREPSESSAVADRIVGADGLGSALADVDFVFLTIPKTLVAARLFGRDMLARMKRGAVLINLSRGGIVGEAALDVALAEGRLAGAVLDVAATVAGSSSNSGTLPTKLSLARFIGYSRLAGARGGSVCRQPRPLALRTGADRPLRPRTGLLKR